MDIQIVSHDLSLPGIVNIPSAARGWVIFAHGSGSSRLSPRNQQVARRLNEAGFATLLFDLLTEEESHVRDNVFDIELLARRLKVATHWLAQQEFVGNLPIAYFGASTGAAAALLAAADLGELIQCIISRGGRPDMAIARLNEVQAPTLLIVGGADDTVLEMNERAVKHLSHGKLKVIPFATHLFEEPGAVEKVQEESVQFLLDHMPSGRATRAA